MGKCYAKIVEFGDLENNKYFLCSIFFILFTEDWEYIKLAVQLCCTLDNRRWQPGISKHLQLTKRGSEVLHIFPYVILFLFLIDWEYQ